MSQLARHSADIPGVVSFHGELDTPFETRRGDMKGKLLVPTGDDDPVIPFTRVSTFRDESRAAKVNFEIDLYSGTQRHSSSEWSTS